MSSFPDFQDKEAVGLFAAYMGKLALEMTLESIETKNSWVKKAVKLGFSAGLKLYSIRQQLEIRKKIKELEDSIQASKQAKS